MSVKRPGEKEFAATIGEAAEALFGPDPKPAARIRALHVGLLLLVGLLWGSQPALIKVATAGLLTEIEALGLVLVLIGISVGLYLAAVGRLFRPRVRYLRFFLLAGTAEYAAPLWVAFLVAPHIDSQLLTLILSTTPLFTVPLAAAVGSEALNRWTVAACLVGVVAMAFLVVPQDALPSPEMLPWCLLGFAAPMLYATGSVFVSRNWPEDLDAVQVAFGGSVVASLFVAPFSIDAVASGRLLANSSGTVVAFTALTLSVIVEMLVYLYLLREAGPVFASFSSFIMIVSGFAIGGLFFAERPTPWIVASMALFTLSLLLVLRSPSRSGAD